MTMFLTALPHRTSYAGISNSVETATSLTTSSLFPIPSSLKKKSPSPKAGNGGSYGLFIFALEQLIHEAFALLIILIRGGIVELLEQLFLLF